MTLEDSAGRLHPSSPQSRDTKDLDIKEFTDEPHDPMIPPHVRPRARIQDLQDPQRILVLGRPTMAELPVDLRDLFKNIRPDFGLAAPGWREAWERGDRDQFLVDTLEEPIRYTEGKSIGIKR
jgi:hypothetical protein